MLNLSEVVFLEKKDRTRQEVQGDLTHFPVCRQAEEEVKAGKKGKQIN